MHTAQSLRTLLMLALIVPAIRDLRADGTQFWTAGSSKEFSQGESEGVSILAEEALSLAPELKLLLDSGQPFIWSLAAGPDGRVYAATGHEGQVLSIGAGGDTATVYDALEPEVMALAVDQGGDLYVGTSPEGRVYRVPGGKGQAETFFDPEEKYIWSMLFDSAGELVVAVGGQGGVYRVDRQGHGRRVLQSTEPHIICLALDRTGNILAGSSGDGLLFQVDRQDRVSILHDSNLKDLRSIAVDSENNIFAAGFELQSPTAQPRVMVPTPQGAAERPSDESEGQPGQEGEQPGQPIILRVPQAGPGLQSSSELYFLDQDRFVTRLWGGNGEAVMALGLDDRDQALFVSTKEKSNLYSIDRRGEQAFLASFPESEVTDFLAVEGRTLFSTSNLGKVYEVKRDYRPRGTFTSQVLNAGIPAEWGTLHWEGEVPSGTDLYFRTRSGNTARPDTTWSPWSDPFRGKAGEVIASPPRVNFQWQAVLSTDQPRVTPRLSNVAISYLRRNRAPMISPLRFMPQGMFVKPAPNPGDMEGENAYPYEVAKLMGQKKGSTDNPFQGKKEYQLGIRMAGWNANDANSDQLRFHVHYRGVEEKLWRPLALELEQNAVIFDTRGMADGKYLLRVTAHDSLDNPGGRALSAERVSPVFTVDNGAPELGGLSLSAGQGTILAAFRATDHASRIERAEVAVDAGPWQPVLPSDGILDSATEEFKVPLEGLSPGEHTVAVRVYDEFFNSAAASRSLTLPLIGIFPVGGWKSRCRGPPRPSPSQTFSIV